VADRARRVSAVACFLAEITEWGWPDARCRRAVADNSHHDGYRAPAPSGPPTVSAATSALTNGVAGRTWVLAGFATRFTGREFEVALPAEIKLSSFSAYWPRLAKGSGRHHGLPR
jgi:hypothetical protein